MSGMKCRGCGEAGHLTFKCPNRGPKKDEANPHQPSDEPVAPNSNKQKPRRFEKPDEPTPPNSNKHNSRRIAHDQEVRNSNKHKPRRVNGQENNNVSKTPKTPASTLRSKEGPNGSLKASHRTLEQTLGFSPKDLLKQQEQFQDVIKTPSSRLSSLALNVAKNLSFNQQEQRSDNFWNKLTEACNKHLQENPCEVEAVAQLCGFSLGTSRTPIMTRPGLQTLYAIHQVPENVAKEAVTAMKAAQADERVQLDGQVQQELDWTVLTSTAGPDGLRNYRLLLYRSGLNGLWRATDPVIYSTSPKTPGSEPRFVSSLLSQRKNKDQEKNASVSLKKKNDPESLSRQGSNGKFDRSISGSGSTSSLLGDEVRSGALGVYRVVECAGTLGFVGVCEQLQWLEVGVALRRVKSSESGQRESFECLVFRYVRRVGKPRATQVFLRTWKIPGPDEALDCISKSQLEQSAKTRPPRTLLLAPGVSGHPESLHKPPRNSPMRWEEIPSAPNATPRPTPTIAARSRAGSGSPRTSSSPVIIGRGGMSSSPVMGRGGIDVMGSPMLGRGSPMVSRRSQAFGPLATPGDVKRSLVLVPMSSVGGLPAPNGPSPASLPLHAAFCRIFGLNPDPKNPGHLELNQNVSDEDSPFQGIWSSGASCFHYIAHTCLESKKDRTQRKILGGPAQKKEYLEVLWHLKYNPRTQWLELQVGKLPANLSNPTNSAVQPRVTPLATFARYSVSHQLLQEWKNNPEPSTVLAVSKDFSSRMGMYPRLERLRTLVLRASGRAIAPTLFVPWLDMASTDLKWPSAASCEAGHEYGILRTFNSTLYPGADGLVAHFGTFLNGVNRRQNQGFTPLVRLEFVLTPTTATPTNPRGTSPFLVRIRSEQGHTLCVTPGSQEVTWYKMGGKANVASEGSLGGGSVPTQNGQGGVAKLQAGHRDAMHEADVFSLEVVREGPVVHFALRTQGGHVCVSDQYGLAIRVDKQSGTSFPSDADGGHANRVVFHWSPVDGETVSAFWKGAGSSSSGAAASSTKEKEKEQEEGPPSSSPRKEGPPSVSPRKEGPPSVSPREKPAASRGRAFSFTSIRDALPSPRNAAKGEVATPKEGQPVASPRERAFSSGGKSATTPRESTDPPAARRERKSSFSFSLTPRSKGTEEKKSFFFPTKKDVNKESKIAVSRETSGNKTALAGISEETAPPKETPKTKPLGPDGPFAASRVVLPADLLARVKALVEEIVPFSSPELPSGPDDNN